MPSHDNSRGLELPPPEDAALQHSRRLIELIIDRIEQRGGVIGFAMQPLLGKTRRKGLAVLEALFGGGAVLAGVLLCLFPPAPTGGGNMGMLGVINPYAHVVTTCRYLEQGREDVALERLQSEENERQVTAPDLKLLCRQLDAMISKCREEADKGGRQGASDPASPESSRVCPWILQAYDNLP